MTEPAREPSRLPSRKALQQRVAAAILDAAAHTFATRGERANLSDVAVAAGMARATVYRYFPNRRRLLDELARHAAEDAHERLKAARISAVPIEEGVTRAVRAFVDMGDAFVVLVRERGAGGTEADEFERRVARPLREMLESGRAAGRIREDIPADSLAEFLVGIAAAAVQHGSLDRDDTVATITRAFLGGALAAPSRMR
jgi:AcrR family transcriptional regulator